METVLYLGIGLFGVGFVLSHVVLGLTRSASRAKQQLKRSHKLLMWAAVGFVVAGLVLSGVGYFALTAGAG